MVAPECCCYPDKRTVEMENGARNPCFRIMGDPKPHTPDADSLPANPREGARSFEPMGGSALLVPFFSFSRKFIPGEDAK